MKITNLIINLLGITLITIGVLYFFQKSNDLTASNVIEVFTNQNESSKSSIPPEKRDPNRLWCNEHGLYEDECVICHPELANANAQTEAKADSNTQQRDPGRLWCSEHGLYEDECAICHPELANANAQTEAKAASNTQKRDPGRLWCSEHGVYEDECVICHPELAKSNVQTEVKVNPNAQQGDLNRLWCKEHGVYEDQCFICHPELANQENSGSQPLFCNEHQVFERECGICQPKLAAQLQPGKGMKIRFASARSSQMAGVRTGKPEMGSALQEHSFPCEVQYNQNQFAHISPLADGVIRRVHVELGDNVTEGQLLVEVASNQIAKAKSEYLKAIDQEHLKKLTYEREKNLSEKNITAKQDFQQAEAEYQVAKTETITAKQQLLNYGLTEEDIDQVRAQRSTSSTLKVRAPFDGAIVEKEAVLGESVKTGQAIFELVNLSSMWIDLSIPESHISHIQMGSLVQAEFPSLPETTLEGQVTWISPQIDAQSRMLKIRAEVENPNQVLKQGLFGQARLLNGDHRPRVLLPSEAVQKVDGNPFVFAQQEDDLYELRRVALGSKTNQMVEILQGVSPEDEIVIDNSFVLKSELLKSRMGAGCVH